MNRIEEDRSHWASRVIAAAALVVALAAVAILLLGREGSYEVKARFVAAPQVVKGGLVQVAGRRIGTVRSIDLTEDGLAELTLAIDDEQFRPLREGTEAHLRIASLSSPTGRIVDLRLPPGSGGPTIDDGGVIEAAKTVSAVNIDQFFAIFDDKTKKGLRNFFRGNAVLYQGKGKEANAGWEYLNPSLLASAKLFREINRDTEDLEGFLVNSSRLVTDVADRRDDLAQLIDRLATTTGAIAKEESSLSTAIFNLPKFFKRANTTFVNLRSTLDTLDPLVAESKPNVPKLRAVLAELRPFARDATPTIRDLARLVKLPGKNNDLIDLAKAIPPFRDIAIGPVQRNGKERRGSLPESAESLKTGKEPIAFFRSYIVDFTGWLDDFSHSGFYDAMGNASRVATSVNAFAAVDGTLKFVPPALRQPITQATTRTGQINRCPGSMERPAEDGSNPWKPTPDFNCDPTQLPPGP